MTRTDQPRTYKHDTAMKQALLRVREVYPPEHTFVTAGSVGNYPTYPKDLEPK